MKFIQEICPWFPEEGGTINLETWQKVGEGMHNHYKALGPIKTPIYAFSLWNLVRDCLDPRCDHNQPSLKLGKKEKECDGTKKRSKKDSILKRNNVNFEDKLNPQDEEDLEEAAAHYHDNDMYVVQAKEEEEYFSARTEEI